MQEQRIDTAKIEQLRKRRAARKRRTAALIIIAFAFAAAYFTGVYGASMAVLADVIDTIAVTIDRGTGWPQSHTVSLLKYADDFASGAVILGDSDFVIYSPSGKPLRTIQHGYGYPAMSVGGTKLCLYNRSGKEVRIESRSRTLNTLVTEQPVMLAEMSRSGSYAVICESTRYAAEMSVYNSMSENVFTWYSAEDTPLVAAISANGGAVSAACIRTSNGGINAILYMFKTGKEEPIAVIESADTMPLAAEYLPNGDLVVLYDSFAAIYSEKDGAEKARFAYNGRALQTAEIGEKATALIFGSTEFESMTQLVVLSEELKVLFEEDIGKIVNNVKLTRTNIFVVLQQSVLSYNFEGTLLGETQASDNTFAVLDAKELIILTDKELLPFTVPKPPEADSEKEG